MSESGECIETWKQLAQELDRRDYTAIRRRFVFLTANKFLLSGRFDVSEDEFILQRLFGGRKEIGVQEIDSLILKDFTKIAKSLNRSVQGVVNRWRGILKPILLSHHFGTLHRPWKIGLFEYLIGKKVIGCQDINYHELKIIFPEQNPYSISLAIGKNKTIPLDQSSFLWKRITQSLSDMKDTQESERVKTYRGTIVDIYDRVKNE